MNADHVSLQVGEGGQVEQALDEVWWACLAQPQEHGLAVLQQEDARVCETLLRAAHRSGRLLAVDVYVVLKNSTKGLATETNSVRWPSAKCFYSLPEGWGVGRAAAGCPPLPWPWPTASGGLCRPWRAQCCPPGGQFSSDCSYRLGTLSWHQEGSATGGFKKIYMVSFFIFYPKVKIHIETSF